MQPMSAASLRHQRYISYDASKWLHGDQDDSQFDPQIQLQDLIHLPAPDLNSPLRSPVGSPIGSVKSVKFFKQDEDKEKEKTRKVLTDFKPIEEQEEFPEF